MPGDDDRGSRAPRAEWLIGGGEMGELVRSMDWSHTPLGPRDQWPPSLRTSASLVLESRFPMALLWGRELILLYNDAYRRIAAEKHPHALGRSSREVWPEVWHINEPIFRAVLERGETTYLEDKLFPIDRHGRREDAYFTLSYGPVRGEEGAVAGCLVTLLETTGRIHERQAHQRARARAEASAGRERELFARVIERLPVLIATYDPTVRCFHVNGEFSRVLGWTDEDARGGDLMALCYPDPEYREQAQRFMQSGEPAWREFVLTAKDGTRVESSWANVRLSDETQVGIGIDLRERKRAEALLREREERLRFVVDSTGIGVFDFRPQTGRLDWSTQAKRHFGLPPEAEVDFDAFLRGLHPADRERVRGIVEDVLRPESGGHYATEYRTIGLEDGKERWLSAWGQVTFEDGEPVRFAGVTLDMTDRKRAEEAARSRDLEFRVLIENLYSGVALVDAEGRFTLYNRRFLEMFGLTADAPVDNVNSQDWSRWQVFDESGRLLHVDDHPVRRAARTREPVRNQLVGVRLPSGGDQIWMLVSAAPLLGNDGRIEHIICTYYEISDRKRAEEALRKALADADEGRRTLQALMDSVPEGITIADAEGVTIRMVSRYGEELLGGPHDGRSVEEVARHWAVYHPDGQRLMAPEDLPLMRAVQRGETVRNAELIQVASDGTRLNLLCNAAPIRDAEGRILGGVVAWRDIRERKRVEKALQEANARLVEADLRKNEFLAVLSHELRNPLAPIRNGVYILEHAAPGGERAKHARQVIDRQAQHMTRLIEDLLDVTRISRGKINLRRERVDLNALARGTADDHREVYSRNGIALEVEEAAEPLWVDGDPTRLAQVIGNLLNNSAKFTPRGGKTVLSVGANARGEGIVRVRDDGAGMSAETLAHVFEPFVQGTQTLERTRGGLGLGLALVKGLVELHGGEVTAHSEGEGKGSEFAVSLPLQAPATPSAGAPEPKRGSEARRVLVVEDNVDAAESLKEVLELENHDVAVAYSGPEGVEAARRYKPDVVFCDIGLPGLDGYDVARALRADPDPEVQAAFLVALSGYALREDVEKSKEAGFDRHLAKPPDIAALEGILAGCKAEAAAAPGNR